MPLQQELSRQLNVFPPGPAHNTHNKIQAYSPANSTHIGSPSSLVLATSRLLFRSVYSSALPRLYQSHSNTSFCPLLT
eukprot:3934163-Rhodomonas_salina.5